MKRITVFAGHYGSGKTNIAVNYALMLKKEGRTVSVADLDIVNPYFRTKDSSDLFEKEGIRLISSAYANTNVDIPALPQDMYAITDDRAHHVVVDLGGDDRGAYALGRISPKIREENDYDMLMVLNAYRPLTKDIEDVLTVFREIEAAGSLPFTGLVNNSNLGAETTAEDVLASVSYAQRVAEKTGLPLVMTTVEASLLPSLEGKILDLFPMTLQEKIF